MRLLITSVIAIFSLAACNTPTQDAPQITHVKAVGPEGKSVAKLSIEGMMCEVGCASKVKKELLELKGVSSVMIDFDDDRKVDFAIVEFDTNTADLDEMYMQVNSIADGKLYGVTAMEITQFWPETK